MLAEDELVPSEVTSELGDYYYELYQKRLDILRDTRSEKIDEINVIADEIKKRVSDWTDEMHKRKDERGDIW